MGSKQTSEKLEEMLCSSQTAQQDHTAWGKGVAFDLKANLTAAVWYVLKGPTRDVLKQRKRNFLWSNKGAKEFHHLS